MLMMGDTGKEWQRKNKEPTKLIEVEFDSCSLIGRKMILMIKDKKKIEKKRKVRVMLRGKRELQRMVRKKLLDGLSPFKATVGDLSCREP